MRAVVWLACLCWLTCLCPRAAIRAADEEEIKRLIQIIQDPDRSHDSKGGAISSLAYHRETCRIP